MLWIGWVYSGFFGVAVLANPFIEGDIFDKLLTELELWNEWSELNIQSWQGTNYRLAPSLELAPAYEAMENLTESEDIWNKAIEDILRDDFSPEPEQDTLLEEGVKDPVQEANDHSNNSFHDFDVKATMDQIDQTLGKFLPHCQPDDFVSLSSNICLQDYCRRPIAVLQNQINGLGFVKKRFNITQRDEIHSYEMELEAMHSMEISPLNSPYLTKIACHGQDQDSVPYVLYEYLSGDDLSWENQFKGMSSGGLKKIFAQFILGLHHFHLITGTIHGDVKPNNIMFTSYKDNDYVKLIDYGGMLPIQGKLWSEVMMFNDMTTAPEVYQDSHTQDRSVSDWFSMAATLYWLSVEHHIANSPEGELSTYLDAFVPIKISQDDNNPTFTIPDRYPPYFEPDLVDLLKRILVTNPYARLNITSIQQHSFFKGLEWKELAISPYPETENPRLPSCYPWEERLETPTTAHQCLNMYDIPEVELKELLGKKREKSAQENATDVQNVEQSHITEAQTMPSLLTIEKTENGEKD